MVIGFSVFRLYQCTECCLYRCHYTELIMICLLFCQAKLWLSSCWGKPTQRSSLAHPLQNTAELLVFNQLEPTGRNTGGLLWCFAKPDSERRHCKFFKCCLGPAYYQKHTSNIPVESYRVLHSQVSNVMSQIIVQKLNGLQVLSPLLQSNKINLQRNTMALMGNLTRNPNLHNAIGERCILPYHTSKG